MPRARGDESEAVAHLLENIGSHGQPGSGLRVGHRRLRHGGHWLLGQLPCVFGGEQGM
jgi:hypothetical protein